MGVLRHFWMIFILALVGCASFSHCHSENIMGRDNVTNSKLEKFLLRNNRDLYEEDVKCLVAIYREECEMEGVRLTVAFAQMCVETGFLYFPGQVRREQNNFCGYGVVDNMAKGDSFPDIRSGVRTHIQHLKYYASTEPFKNRCIDRRVGWQVRGGYPNIMDLSASWATDRRYGQKILSVMRDLAAI